ncbi:hypothetical protein ACTXG6_18940 [Pseudonocardia sp. Cha107L01]|uniref:hypothetical protein n=1 Tax=Pseudonocardia sp. Cha107L01 TaxID=3457576 RepID=UPI00403E7D03
MWRDSSVDEWWWLMVGLVKSGAVVRLLKKPNSFWCASGAVAPPASVDASVAGFIVWLARHHIPFDQC